MAVATFWARRWSPMTAIRRTTRTWMTAAMVLLGATARAEFGDPVGGLTIDELARFTAGRDTFEEVETVADRLGPAFNGASCAASHNDGGTGGAATLVETGFGK